MQDKEYEGGQEQKQEKKINQRQLYWASQTGKKTSIMSRATKVKNLTGTKVHCFCFKGVKYFALTQIFTPR